MILGQCVRLTLTLGHDLLSGHRISSVERSHKTKPPVPYFPFRRSSPPAALSLLLRPPLLTRRRSSPFAARSPDIAAVCSHRRRSRFLVPPVISQRLPLGREQSSPAAASFPLTTRERMALRRPLGLSNGELMRSDCKPCTRLMRHTAGIFSVGGALSFWILCRIHYGPRITIPRTLRWASCGAIAARSSSALLVRLFSPECEPQNIAAVQLPK
ncbi:uncharacterized protein LOC122043937 [Zingiber officinale]|uniref:uncharacterized protein LOC122043937 n=1 Tax=Zingiber officinale TaxID=94328 RepID=UPI001C4CDFA7|nr:uncharacterized protein LOC122043937 [Zingiber officinale]